MEEKTSHSVIFSSASEMGEVASGSVGLVVTSPPYPMIEMWDGVFGEQDPGVRAALRAQDGDRAFEMMHRVLDPVWDAVYRVLRPGGIACVNIGDATRTIGGEFRLYSNHSRVLNHCLRTGFQALPGILWRKQTNAPNKFMGSGMLPPGAYVTLEHEYVLVLRKGGKRAFRTPGERSLRQRSGFFWEERNLWFSDVWTGLKGVRQGMDEERVRERSGAFPFELACRLVNMFSVQGDVVLDPFLGTGTSMMAAMASCRHSVGYEIDAGFSGVLESRVSGIVARSNGYIGERLAGHLEFVAQREGKCKYRNQYYGFPVMTRQEVEILIPGLRAVRRGPGFEFEVVYDSDPQADFCRSISSGR